MNEDMFNLLKKTVSATIEQINKTEAPHTVCVCGSSRFCDLIAVVKWELEKAGIMSTGLHYLPDWYGIHAKWDKNHHGAEQEKVAHILDELHLKKIDNYGIVLVINPNGYIGDRTQYEIDYATKIGKPILYWSMF